MHDTIVIETPRLRLRQWRDSDYPHFAAMNADPRVMEHFPAPLDRNASDAFAGRLRAEIAERGWGFWAVGLREEEGSFIGFTGLRIPVAQLPIGACVEIGWRLAAPHWGKGHASEAAGAALAHGFGMLGLDEIVSFTALSNLRSQAVMRRIGMRHDGEIFEHPNVAPGHPLRPHCLYRLRAEDWKARGRAR